MERNSKFRLRGDKNETIYHVISQCSKTWQNWVGKVIHRELCKKLKFDPTTLWYMHKLVSVQENETHKVFWKFEIQADHLFPIRRPDLMILDKKNTERSE